MVAEQTAADNGAHSGVDQRTQPAAGEGVGHGNGDGNADSEGAPGGAGEEGDQALRTKKPVETITFEGEEAPELTGNPFPFKESILKIMVPSGKSEAYKAKWDSYESYHSKIEEKS